MFSQGELFFSLCIHPITDSAMNLAKFLIESLQYSQLSRSNPFPYPNSPDDS
jgi:hypothetical protein